MKKIIITICLSFILGLIINSCTNELLDSSVNESLSRAKQNEKITFSYKGLSYTSGYKMVNDSVLVLEDLEINNIYQEIQELPDLFSLTNEKGDIVFYDSINEYLIGKDIDEMDSMNLREAYANPDFDKPNKIYLSGQGGNIIFKMGRVSTYKIPDLEAFQMYGNLGLISVEMSRPFTIYIFKDPDFKGKAKGFEVTTPNGFGGYVLTKDLFHEDRWTIGTSSVLVRVQEGSGGSGGRVEEISGPSRGGGDPSSGFGGGRR